MKVAFVASHTQKQELFPYYKRAYDFLKSRQHEVMAGTLFDDKETVAHDQATKQRWYKESIEEVQRADIVVVEISYPSTANVGHELTYALDLGKPVIALYKEGRDPIFLSGRSDDKLLLFPYTDKDLEEVLASGMEYATTVQDVRFNFFISPQIGTYLDWISKNKRIPRAVYLRKMIEEDMRENKEYSESK